MATKRKHHEVTLKESYDALKELVKGRSIKDFANQSSIPGIALVTWKKNKEKIFEAFKNSSLKRQRLKTGTYKKLNEALLKWFTVTRMRFPTNPYHHHHEMKVTKQLKS